jgi:hypothetical protein
MPWLIWQARHGLPQLHVSSAIASGGSASSQPRWAFLPFQFLLVSPVLAPVWIAGLVGLLRRQQLRSLRFFAIAWFVLAALFLATGGKPYYLAGMFPVLLAAGSLEADLWLTRGVRQRRVTLIGGALVLSAVVSALLALPILPASSAAPVVAMNADAGETIGWPEFVQTVASAYRRAHSKAVIFTSNYGEAGAIDRFGRALNLPSAFSGHNGFADWGPPPDTPQPVLAVGVSPGQLGQEFRACHEIAQINNVAGVDNEERGTKVDLCAGTRAPWSKLWPYLRHLG